MDLHLTRKEVETLGYNRYMSRGRFYKVFGIFLLGCAVGFLISSLIVHKTPTWLYDWLPLIPVVLSMIPLYVAYKNSNKAGVNLADEWEKGTKNEQANH
jgi:uncharacterized membrane protein YfcA